MLLIPIFTGCRTESQVESPPIITELYLAPYITPTPTQPHSNQGNTGITPTPIPSLTPTPYLYTIIKNDTLTSIAFKHGIKLKDLVAANPGIDPNFLIIGMTVTIPLSGNLSVNLPVLTPIPMAIYTPICYTEPSGGLVCLSTVENTHNFDVENLSARIDLISPHDPESLSKDAILPITILPARRSAILSTYFPPPLLDYSIAQVTLNSTIPVDEGKQRYLDLTVKNESIEIFENQLQAEVSGEITISNQNQVADYVWVAAFAYDNENDPIGFRKWVFDNSLAFGDTLQFKFIVNTLGPPIEKVEVLYEARP